MSTLNIAGKTLVSHVRGCKTRRAGMTYMVTDESWFRKYPLSYFLFDPPILIENPNAWGLSAQGISYVNKNGIIHAQDWIGRGTSMNEGGYWNAADILEEAVNIGGSGLVPLTNQIGELTAGKSRRLLFHPAGWLYNAKEYKKALVQEQLPDCPKPGDSPEHKHHLSVNEQMCAMLHWQTVEGGQKILGRYTQRQVGETSYKAAMPLENFKPKFGLALIAWLPIDELHVVEGDDEKVKKALTLLSKISQLPVYTTNV